MKWNEAKIRYDKLGPKVVENLKKRGDPFLGGKAEKISEVIHTIVREDIAKEDNEK